MTSIEIKECYGEHVATTSIHRAEEVDQAIERAVAKRYGKKAVFVENMSLRANQNVRFGQVYRRIPKTISMTNITWQLCITVR